jgi:hypothetical protein
MLFQVVVSGNAVVTWSQYLNYKAGSIPRIFSISQWSGANHVRSNSAKRLTGQSKDVDLNRALLITILN